jgi:hypothetical protein
MNPRSASITVLCLLGLAIPSAAQSPLYHSGAFSVYPDRVTQGKFTARAISPDQLTSNYSSPANAYQSADLSFKFAINGKDTIFPSIPSTGMRKHPLSFLASSSGPFPASQASSHLTPG